MITTTIDVRESQPLDFEPGPLVSVVIPCFNQSQYAYESVLSAKMAYRGPLQIIIIDDGSSDPGTVPCLNAVTERLADNRCSMEIFSIQNRGLSGARNFGIKKARGHFVQLLDCDDLLLPGKLDIQVLHFSIAWGLNVSLTDCIYSNDELDLFERYSNLMSDSSFSLADFANKWERGLSIPIHCALFRRSLFETYSFDEGQRSKEDWIFWIALASNREPIAFLGAAGAVYRVHDNSLCRASADTGRQWLSAALKIDPLVKSVAPSFLDDAVYWYTRNYTTRPGATGADQASTGRAPARNAPLLKEDAIARYAKSCPKMGAQTPKASIVIPVHEHFDFLPECIGSALSQMDGTVEIIVVDDGSKDSRIRAVLERIRNIDGVHVYFNEKNLGVSETLNRAVACASGSYIAFLDCDDMLAPGALKRALSKLEETGDCDYFFSDRYDVSENNEILRLARYGGYADDRFIGDLRSDLLNGMVASHLKILKRESIMKCGGFDAEFSGVQDWSMALKFLPFASFVYLPEPLYCYRVHRKTITNSRRRAQLWNTNVVRRRLLPQIVSRPEGRDAQGPRVMKPADVNVREIVNQWVEQPLFLDLSEGISQDHLWRIREFNSYFDRIFWRDPSIFSALIGYVWSPDALVKVPH